VADDDFEPRLGRLGDQGGAGGRSYLQRVLHARARAGGKGRIRQGFNGTRIARGAVAARLLAGRDRFSGLRTRRVMVKTRMIRLNRPKARGAAAAHMRYIQRDGVTREGQPGRLYGADQDRIDGRDFLDRQAGDRHQFRFIVSPEDGAEYQELKGLTRRLMAQMEKDLGTKLDWVAVDHFNTGHPHTHIVLRGKTDLGADLVIAPEYLTSGLRERAAELVSVDLGPRTGREIEGRLRAEVEQERLTSLDRNLLRGLGGDRTLVVAGDARGDTLRHALNVGRLRKLADLGLASQIGPNAWSLSPDMEDTLRRMGERGDIVRTLQRAFTSRGIARAARDHAVFDPASSAPLVGRIVERGLSDELQDRHYLIVDATDGRVHYVDIGKGEETPSLPLGAVVRLSAKSFEPRAADRTVAEVAAAYGGRYSVELHLRHDRSATETFAETHVRRLEAMRRALGNLEREADGTWLIGEDHLARASAYAAHQAKAAPVIVETLSNVPLDKQIGTDGATWLDRELIGDKPEATQAHGFGAELNAARIQRQRWLIDQGLAEEEHGRIVYRANLLANLQQRELRRVAGQLSETLGLAYVEIRPGERVAGVYKQPIELASGRFAVIENSREFTLVPWRPVLDRHLDRPVSGIMKGDGVSWSLGRSRSGPSVS